MSELQTNTLLQGGKYKIEKSLGQGGFGITYLAEQTNLGRKVCIKEFFMKEYGERTESPDADSDATVLTGVNAVTSAAAEIMRCYREKFVKEARTIARLDHPGIVRIHDVFEENGTAYYVMDFIEGENLNDLVKREGPLSEERALGYIRQVADALSFVHGHNIMHLDVKPANILVRKSDDKAVLIDFGTAKQYDSEGTQTSTTPIGISAGYAPIEMTKPGGVQTFSPETDVYSLGATLYYLVTGQNPPDASERMEMIEEGEMLSFPEPVSSAVSDTVEKSMRTRKKRIQTVALFLESLPAPSNVAPKETHTLYCSKCGRELALDARFCPNCGTAVALQDASNEHTVNHVEKPKEEKKMDTGLENGHEWVDLGLPSGTLWATCNVGATKPEEEGDFYAWGETSPKDEYTGNNYKHFKVTLFGKIKVLKYFAENKQLELCDDAAHVNWGKGWRIPTIEEFGELIENCTMVWTKVNRVKGRLFTSKFNGNSIFFPASGWCRYDEIEGEYGTQSEYGTEGNYWSSVLDKDDINRAHFMFFGDDYVITTVACYYDEPEDNDDNSLYWRTTWRCNGLSVRPVLSAK